MTYKKYQAFMQSLLAGLIILACFSINLPTAWMGVSIILIFIMFFLTGNLKNKILKIKNNPGAVATILFFILCMLGFFYSSGAWDMKVKFLSKYMKLLLIPIVLSSISSPKVRLYGIYAFILSTLFVLCISYGKWLHILSLDLGIYDIATLDYGYAVYRNRIAHNIFMSFAMYVFLVKADKSEGWIKNIWFILAMLAFFNVMYIVNGRSGQIICLSLLGFYGVKKWGKKFLSILLGLCLVAFIFKPYFEPLIPERLAAITSEIADTEKNHDMTSSGIRYVMYQSVFDMGMKSPLWGHGIGSLKDEYSHINKEAYALNLEGMDNPHNQYLLIFFELGAIGLFLFLYMNVPNEIGRAHV